MDRARRPSLTPSSTAARGVRGIRAAWVLAALSASSLAAQVDDATDGAAGLARVNTKLGGCALTIPGLQEPTGVASLADGGWVIVESAGPRLCLFDAQGKRGASFGDQLLLEPRDVALLPSDAEGKLANGFVVSDMGRHALFVFAADGEHLATIGKRGAGDGCLNMPDGLDVAGGRIAVADTQNQRVALFDLRGGWLGAWGGPDELRAPTDVVFGAEGDCFVADGIGQRVLRLDPSGKQVAAFGTPGPNPGQFAGPTGVFWRAGLLHVVDRDNSRVQVFDAAGALDNWYGIHALRPREGDGKLHYPLRVALNADGSRAAVVEPVEGRMQVLGPVDPSLPVLAPLPALPPSHFGGAVDADGGLLVTAEPSIPRVQLWRMQDGEPIEITNFGTYGEGSGQMLWPADVALDARARRIYVADSGSARISVFDFRFEPSEETGFDPERARFVLQRDLSRGLDGKDAAQRIDPQGLWRDAEGGICVADPRNRAVWRFDAGLTKGERVATRADWLEPVDGCVGRVADAGATRAEDWVVDRLGGRVVSLHDGRTVAKGFRRPAAALFASNGVLLVSDSAADAILGVDLSGQRAEPIVLAQGPGLGPDQVTRPRGLAELAGGRFVAIDWANHRGVIRALDGKFQRAFGSRLFLVATFAAQTEKQAEPASTLGPAPRPAPFDAAAVPSSAPWHGTQRLISNDGRFAVFVRPTPDPIQERQTFSLEIFVTARAQPDVLLSGLDLRVDAAMPEHGHGINVVPKTTRLGDGHFRVEGTRLHMPGRWEVYVDLREGTRSERAQWTLELD